MIVDVQEEGVLVQSAGVPEASAEEWVPGTTHGPSLRLMFDPTLVLDGIKMIEGPAVWWQFAGVQSPSCLETEGGGPISYVVLPLRELV